MSVKVRERNGAWWLYIDHDGRRKAKRVGPGKSGKKAAELAAVQIAAKLASGNPAVFARQSTVPTFTMYAERWLIETITPHRKPRTVDYYRAMLDQHLVPAFGTLALPEITPPQVRTLVADKLSGRACSEHRESGVESRCRGCVPPLARNTVKNMAATLRAIMYQAQHVDGILTSNPAAHFGRFFDA